MINENIGNSIIKSSIVIGTEDIRNFGNAIEVKFEFHTDGSEGRRGTKWAFPIDQIKDLKLSPARGQQQYSELKVFSRLDREELRARNERSILLHQLAFKDVEKAMGSKTTLSERNVHHLKTINDENCLNRFEAEVSALAYINFSIRAKIGSNLPVFDATKIDSMREYFSSLLAEQGGTDEVSPSVEVMEIKPNLQENGSPQRIYLKHKGVLISTFSNTKQKAVRLLPVSRKNESKVYLSTWTMPMSGIDLQERSDFEKAYNDFGAKEQDVSSHRNRTLREIAIMEIATASNTSLADRKAQVWSVAEPLIKKLEGEGGAFRYAQYFIIQKYLLTHPPLERTPMRWYPTEKGMIQYFVESRNIQHLVHFTQAANLKSIMKHGLLSVATIRSTSPLVSMNRVSREENGLNETIYAKINDPQRLDKCPDGTSCSLSFPNDVFFYARRERQGTTDKAWAVLLLKPSILWEKNCVFNHHNGASGELSEKTPEERSTLRAFQSMFEDVSGPNSRTDAKLESFDATSTQAEIFVRDSISTDYITEIKFVKEDHETQYAPLLGNKKVSVDKAIFGQREWVRKSKS